MSHWKELLRIDPLPRLLDSGDEALIYWLRRDLSGPDAPSDRPSDALWGLPDALQILRRQQDNGSWRYKGKVRDENTYGSNYDLLETFRYLRLLVETYGMTRKHPGLHRAAEYVLSCQTEKGDIRGIIGNQYMPYYCGAIVELLVKAGYADDARVDAALRWLLSVRQDDGGWIVPMQAVPSGERSDEMFRGDPIPPDRSRPFSHLATGMVLRAFAAHPGYRHLEETWLAGERLKSRFFRGDKYNDRRAPAYWLKFGFPFWWTSLLTALDSLSRIGFPADDPDVARGIEWFQANQDDDGLWPTGYGSGRKAEANRQWVVLAVCRVLQRYTQG